jgi:hypothetical protein
MAVMMAQASKAPPDIRDSHPELDVTDTVAELINDCLVKDADKRLGSANDLLDRIKHARFELNQDITGSSSGRLMIDPSLLGEKARNRPGRTAQAMAETVVPVSEASTAPLGHPIAKSGGSGLISLPLDDDDEVRLPKRNTGVFIGLGVVALAGVGAFFALRGSTPTEQPQPPGPASDAPGSTAPSKIQHEIESTPARATVMRDGAVIGKTPMRVVLKPGEKALLTLTLPGYQDKQVELNGSGPNEQSQLIDLVPGIPGPPSSAPASTQAWFHIESTPPDAEIWFGDKLLGKTPFDWRPGVSEKLAELRIAKKGFKVEVRQLKLAAVSVAEDVKVTLVPAGPGGGPGPGPKAPGPAPATKAPGPAPATKAPGPAPATKAPDPTYEKL